jgi:hypothetical protein
MDGTGELALSALASHAFQAGVSRRHMFFQTCNKTDVHAK